MKLTRKFRNTLEQLDDEQVGILLAHTCMNCHHAYKIKKKKYYYCTRIEPWEIMSLKFYINPEYTEMFCDYLWKQRKE